MLNKPILSVGHRSCPLALACYRIDRLRAQHPPGHYLDSCMHRRFRGTTHLVNANASRQHHFPHFPYGQLCATAVLSVSGHAVAVERTHLRYLAGHLTVEGSFTRLPCARPGVLEGERTCAAIWKSILLPLGEEAAFVILDMQSSR